MNEIPEFVVVAKQTGDVQLGEVWKRREAADATVHSKGSQCLGSARKKGYVLVVAAVGLGSGEEAHFLQIRHRNGDGLHEAYNLAREGTPDGESTPPSHVVTLDDLRVNMIEDIEVDGHIEQTGFGALNENRGRVEVLEAAQANFCPEGGRVDDELPLEFTDPAQTQDEWLCMVIVRICEDFEDLDD